MKKKLLLITILFVGLTIKAQQIKIRPSISYAATYSAFQHSTIPEPYFSTTFSANSFLGLNIEWHMTNKYAAYLKIANHGVSNSIKDVNQIKPNLFTSNIYKKVEIVPPMINPITSGKTLLGKNLSPISPPTMQPALVIIPVSENIRKRFLRFKTTPKSPCNPKLKQVKIDNLETQTY